MLFNRQKTLIMGVMNLTPDSFSQDGLLKVKNVPSAHLRYAKGLVNAGADILDIGGESTRPGAKKISASEEIRRVLPTLRLLVKHLDVPVSIDTYKADVAHACLDEGGAIINNIMGTRIDRRLLKLVHDYDCRIVLMHSRGNPHTMNTKTRYKDILNDIIEELRVCLNICFEIGIKKDRIILDPGIGFAKTPVQNLEILNRLGELKQLQFPVLVGSSRKSFIGHVLNNDVHERAWGTAATIAVAIANGADIIRVHDVKAMKEVAAMTDAIVRFRK